MSNTYYNATRRFLTSADRRPDSKHVKDSVELTDALGRRYRLERIEDVEPETEARLWHDELEEDG